MSKVLVPYPKTILFGSLIALVLYKVCVGRKKEKNPFASDTCRPPLRRPQTPAEAKALEDKTNAITRDIYRPAKVPENLDAIVIGSGISGLTTAALMAKAGKRVLVLEQHDRAGGCCHSFTDQGYKFDPGIHYVGSMHERGSSKFFLDQLTEGQLEWEPMDNAYDVFVCRNKDGTYNQIPMVSNINALKESLAQSFPKERAAIDKWHALNMEGKKSALLYMLMKILPKSVAHVVRYVLTWMGRFHLSLHTIHEVIAGLTDDPLLQLAMCYSYGDHGGHPKTSPFFVQSLVSSHYFSGAWYPVGGADQIPATLIPVIKRAGGNVLVKGSVKELVMEGSRVVGVKMATADQATIYAPVVVSSSGLANTVQRLLPNHAAAKVPRNLLKLKPSSGSLSLFIGLNASAEELGLKAQQFWIYETVHPKGDRTLHEVLEDGFEMLFVTFPSVKDPVQVTAQPNRSTCNIITFADYEWFAEWEAEQALKRSSDYDSLKNALGQKLWEQTLKHFPQLKDKVDYFEVGSPLTNDYYLGQPQGAIYGLKNDMARWHPATAIDLRPDVGIPGLSFTGQDIFSPGFSGALLGGFVTASALLGRNVYLDGMKLYANLFLS